MTEVSYVSHRRSDVYYGFALSADEYAVLRDVSVDYLMSFWPVPVLRKRTKRGRLRWQGKMRARERLRCLYAGEPHTPDRKDHRTIQPQKETAP